MEGYLTYSLLVIIITIAVFFIFRSVLLWYWKINQMVSLLEDQLRILKIVHREEIEKFELEKANIASQKLKNFSENMTYDDLKKL